jgi:hypothetical protein
MSGISSIRGNQLPKAANIFLKLGKVLPIHSALNFFCGFPSSKDRLLSACSAYF